MHIKYVHFIINVYIDLQVIKMQKRGNFNFICFLSKEFLLLNIHNTILRSNRLDNSNSTNIVTYQYLSVIVIVLSIAH
jgi:hypothetical protein